MRIGELSATTGVSRRLLRYYEEQGLLTPDRDGNGYRSYCGDTAVDRVLQIRGLLDAGLPTSIIRDLLPCLNRPRQIHVDAIDPEMLARLIQEEQRMTQRISCLSVNRDAIRDYLSRACASASLESADSRAADAPLATSSA